MGVTNFADRAGEAAFKVGAALETAGYRAQQDLLPYFNGEFGAKLGGLLYLIGIITALLILSSGGSYRYGLWLLIGPPVFYFLVGNTTRIQPAQWHFGERVHDEALVLRTVEGMGGPATVSTFFAFWNRLTSQVIQELIKTLDITNRKSDLDFVSKSDRYHALWTRQNADRDVQFFVHMAVVTPCMDYFYLLRFVNDPFIPENRKIGARVVLENHGGRAAQAFNVTQQPWFLDWWNRVMATAPCQALKPTATRAYTCDEMWQVGVCAMSHLQAPAAVQQICGIGLPDGYTTSDCVDRLLQKFRQRINNGRVISSTQNDGAASLNLMLNELSGRLLFNEFYRQSAPLMRLNLGNHPNTQHGRAFGGARYSQETAQAMREMMEGEQYTARGEIIAAAINLPYFQGTLLYFLAWTFPFFALMTVVPGRESAICIWMGLWLWVKLWDLGFAVVMMIDNMLYALLPHGDPMSDEELRAPGRAMRILFQTDPSYSAFTYYTLLAACIFSVPAITGLLVKKGGGELISVVTQGIKDFPTDFGRALGGAKRAEIANEQWSLAAQYIRNETMAQTWDAIINDPEILQAMVEAAAMDLGNAQFSASLNRMVADPTNMGARAEAYRLFQSNASNIVSRMLQFDASVLRSTALARFEVNMQMAAYRASTSPFVVQRAQAAMRQGWNSHDFRRAFPAESFLRWSQARNQGYIWDGRMADAWQENLADNTMRLLQFFTTRPGR